MCGLFLPKMISIFIPLIQTFQVIAALLIVLLVLMQRPKQEGLGANFGVGVTDQMFGAQTTNVLQKATVTLGIFFFTSTLILSILYNRKNTTNQIEFTAPAPSLTVPASDSLSEQLKVAQTELENKADLSTDDSKSSPPVSTLPKEESDIGSLLKDLEESKE